MSLIKRDIFKTDVLPKQLKQKKEPSRGVLRKRCSENLQQIYRRTPMPKCDFNKIAKQLYSKSHFDMGVLL